ncbi:DUF1611 domain-containing protein [Cellulophaga sp. BC115SP]|uniref:DUF1611 domain-containing protein n=1 Tax=Cellulophaga sp. BC115SP TaxID=2683263 RepID=UPI001411C3AE|nr:DUF1611 domain-containing protein [Cellulophaga sp. BC115SP]NBB30023.1 DUF1611 domain-containing protein [Cellulophaga sp. BC115SP]
MNKAIVLTNGLLETNDAKTAHGLIRGTERFEIVGVIDTPKLSGQDAGEVLDGKHRNIPVFGSLEEAIEQLLEINYLIIGVATVGGVLPPAMVGIVEKALGAGISVVNGLHEYLTDNPVFVKLAEEKNLELIDIRKPKKRQDLHFWTGEINQVDVPIVAVMGMDCALGKRTTARLLRQCAEQKGISAEMIYTGQTGWLQGGKYGFVFDSTLNDFVSGELEHAIVTCWKEAKPAFILLEGQSALRNPSGPCGFEFIISGNAKKVVLVHAPKRKYYDNDPHWGEIPSVSSEIELIQKLGAEVIALALNTEDCTEEEYLGFRDSYQKELEIPVILPLQDGVEEVLKLILN